MPEIEDITDQTLETIEDEFSGLFCECKHLLSDHSIGKCRFFGHNGTMFYNCDCKQKKPIEFKIKVYVNDEEISPT